MNAKDWMIIGLMVAYHDGDEALLDHLSCTEEEWDHLKMLVEREVVFSHDFTGPIRHEHRRNGGWQAVLADMLDMVAVMNSQQGGPLPPGEYPVVVETAVVLSAASPFLTSGSVVVLADKREDEPVQRQ